MGKRKLSAEVPPTPTVRRKILVGLDYGTTFSGVAWVQTARPDAQTPIIQWPDVFGSLEGQTSEKVPTQICYVDDIVKWGFGIPDDAPRYQWFKLGLDPSLKDQEISLLAIDYPDPKALPPGYNNKPDSTQLSTDYLTQLRKHTDKILRRKLGDSVVGTTPIRYTITVPAIWSDLAKAKTRKCATDAGMGQVRIISEPEAAVIYALDAMDPHSLKIGDKFLPADAGGGTVDLICYEVVELKPIVKVCEAVPGSGSACGSTFLNRIFRKYLEELLQDLDGFGDDTIEDAMVEFENITKRKFTGDEQSIMLRVPGLADNAEKGVKRGKLTIKGEVIKDRFKPVMTVITSLVKCQLQQCKQAKAVILVGGFGQSPYLRNCIEQVVGKDVEIHQPVHGWTAVVRGALLRAMHDAVPEMSRVSIGSRRARAAYGLKYSIEYDPIKHAGAKTFWSDFWGHDMVNLMKWFVVRGDELNQKEPITTSWSIKQEVSEGGFGLFEERIKTSESAPEYPNEEVKQLLTITADLSSIRLHKLPIKTGADGKAYYDLAFQVKVAFFSAHMEFSLWYNKKEYGKVKAEYD